MKKKIKIFAVGVFAVTVAAIPFVSDAIFTVPWVATSTTQGWIQPSLINGKKQTVVGDSFFATSTTATSTFLGSVLITDGSQCNGCGTLPSTPLNLVGSWPGAYQEDITNTDNSNFALSSVSLGVSNTTFDGFFSQNWCGILEAGPNYNVPGFNGIKPNGGAFACSNGSVSIGSASMDAASSSIYLFFKHGGFETADAVFDGNSGAFLLGTTSTGDALGINELTVQGASNTNIIKITDGFAELGSFIDHTTSNDQVQIGSISNSDFSIFTNNGLPTVTVKPWRDVGIASSSPFARLAITGTSTDGTNAFLVADQNDKPLFDVENNGKVGVASSTPGTIFSIGGTANFTTATTSFYSTGGVNLAAGCFAISGVCITGGGTGSGTVNEGSYGNIGWYAANGTAISATSGPLTVASIYSTTTATSTFKGDINATALTTSASSTLNAGINMTSGCFAINNVCVTSGSATLSGGSPNTLTYWTAPTTVSATGSPTVGYLTATSTLSTSPSYFAGYVSIGTTTPRNPLVVSSSTASQICSSDGGTNIWCGRSSPNGSYYFGSTTVASNATNTPSALELRSTGPAGLGIGTSTPFSVLSVSAPSGTTPLFSIATTTAGSTIGQNIFMVDSKGHVVTGGISPTAGSCGVSPATPTGDDNSLFETAGSGVLTSCTINFGSTWTKSNGTTKVAPACHANDVASTALALDASSTPTTVVITGTSLTSIVFSVQCSASDNMPSA